MNFCMNMVGSVGGTETFTGLIRFVVSVRHGRIGGIPRRRQQSLPTTNLKARFRSNIGRARCRFVLFLSFVPILTGCAGTGAPSTSSAEQSLLGGIASYDQNHDGTVTCDEWRAVAAKLFATADRAASGYLSQADFTTLSGADRTFLAADFRFYDMNKDGKVTRMEFVERPNPAFELIDKNKDCRLDPAELAAARTRTVPPAGDRL
jgi:Ca2+-binding EF-hand superfamily protein